MFCSKCGKEVQNGQAFCPNCGNSVDGNSATTQTVEKTTAQSVTPQQVSVGQVIDQKRFVCCGQCGQIYAKKQRSIGNLALSVLGIFLILFFFTLPLGVILLGFISKPKQAVCPCCGNTEDSVVENRLCEKQFEGYKAPKYKNFYAKLHSVNEKWRLTDICRVLMVVCAYVIFFLYYADVTLIGRELFDVEKVKGNLVALMIATKTGFTVFTIITCLVMICFVWACAYKKIRLNLVAALITCGICLLHLILIFIISESYLLGKIADESYISVEVQGLGWIKFGLIALQLLVIAALVFLRELDKAEWLNKTIMTETVNATEAETVAVNETAATVETVETTEETAPNKNIEE